MQCAGIPGRSTPTGQQQAATSYYGTATTDARQAACGATGNEQYKLNTATTKSIYQVHAAMLLLIDEIVEY
jgi:hypothetical protein